MKKTISIFLIIIMIFSMIIPAIAAPSPIANGIVNEIIKSIDSKNNELNISMVEINSEDKNFNKLKSTDRNIVSSVIKEVLECENISFEDISDNFNVKYKNIDELVSKLNVVDIRDLKLNSDKAEWPINITFDISGVNLDTTLMVLYFNENAWRVLPSKIIGENKVQVELESLSSVAFLIDPDTTSNVYNDEAQEEDINEEVDESKKSSVTYGIVALIGLLLIVSFIIFLTNKKNSENQ